jgi:hypothetical protein
MPAHDWITTGADPEEMDLRAGRSACDLRAILLHFARGARDGVNISEEMDGMSTVRLASPPTPAGIGGKGDARHTIATAA